MNENNPTAKPIVSDPGSIATPPAPHTVEPVKMPDTAQPKDTPKTNS